MSPLFHKLPAIFFVSALGALSSCIAPGESGQCSVDEDCTGRGQICNTTTATCENTEYDASSTESPAPGSFTDKVIPFFRGTVCTVTDPRSGSAFPMTMTPCFDPCITVKSFKFKHFYECQGAACNAWALMWVVADGDACPANAFSNDSQCQSWDPTDGPIEFKVDTTLESGPIVGTMTFEVPFLTNEDMAALAPTGGENPATEAIKARIFQYPRDPDRLINGAGGINLLNENPLPPETCAGNQCSCFTI